MCETHVYPQVRPDGRLGRFSRHELCSDSYNEKPCGRVQEFQHSSEYRHMEQLSPYGQFPPSPPLSSHSASDSERSSKRRSGVYTNGQKVLDVNHKRSRSPRHERSGRVVYVDSPPLSRTPPRQYTLSRSMPSSPNADERFGTHQPRYREPIVDERERERPTTAHLRPAIKVEVINDRPQRRSHHRRTSSSKTSSRDSSEEERRRRAEKAAKAERDADRELQRNLEIAKANQAIAGRSAMPSAPTPPALRYRRGSVVIDRTDHLAAGMNQLNLDPEVERRRLARQAEKIKQREDEAQAQRLKERLNIGRRNTVGSASKRPKEYYPTYVYGYD
ncbi:Uu.00g000690.m01.CDS01 [Anthostomella pinea]|uniref:Uu.00g000690.m01.CDS01 n=1 Tax=Anthostomella pinea TaxID=933095 RepID=A0AAI8YIF4_9PEZI|nr:Uu.00g000690.m01.CDS01 [Anthostomella pinea]